MAQRTTRTSRGEALFPLTSANRRLLNCVAPVNVRYHSGNVEPHRGFGHVAMMVDNLDAACAELEKKDVKFQKKPSDGKMKTIAFALDPDGYWVEIVTRKTEAQVRE